MGQAIGLLIGKPLALCIELKGLPLQSIADIRQVAKICRYFADFDLSIEILVSAASHCSEEVR
jgi:hypothetical protein